MYRPFIAAVFLLFSILTRAQPVSQETATAMLPAFRKDDSTLLKTLLAGHHANDTVLINLAAATNAPRIFRYILDHFPAADVELPVFIALRAGNQPVLEAVLDKQLSLGEYPVNQLLATEFAKEEENTSFDLYLELLLLACIPESSLNDFKPLLIREATPEERADIATWMIGRQLEFNYQEYHRLVKLPPVYQPVARLLVQQLRNTQPGQTIGGFDDAGQALVFTAVLNNDLPVLRSAADGVETVEFNIGNRSLLSYAVAWSDLAVIRFLLARGADPDWQDAPKGLSVLGTLLNRGDETILQTVMPYIKKTDITLKDGNTPVYHCVYLFYQEHPDSAAASRRKFYLTALKALRHNSADFNQLNGRHELPLDLVPGELKDSLSCSTAILVLEHTTDQMALYLYGGRYKHTSPGDIPVLRTLCRQMPDAGSLFYNSDLAKAGLQPLMLQEVRQLPGLQVFSNLLRSATYSKNVPQVRWLLNEVPKAYANRNASMNPDSIRKAIVNTSTTGDGENVLYYFLNQTHTIDWPARSVMKALMAAGADIYQEQTSDRKRPIDLLLSSAEYQKGYVNEILSGLLPEVHLQCNDSAAWQRTATGDNYRKALLTYQQDRKWLQQLQNCITMDLSGPSVTGPPNRRVKITGVGTVPLGTFPMKRCDPFEADKIAGNPPRFVFSFSSRLSTSPSQVFSSSGFQQGASSVRASLVVEGHAGVENMTMTVTDSIDIPGAVYDADNHSIPPMIFIENDGDPVIVHQQDAPHHLVKGAREAFDRSKGPLQIRYQHNSGKAGLSLNIYGCIQDTEFPDLVVPVGADPVSRMRLYAEIVRLQDRIRADTGKTAGNQVLRKQNEALIHLLSEYALQRYYPQRIKEEYQQNLTRITDINKLLEQLGLFYEQHAVLDFSNVGQLRATLQALLDDPLLSVQQRREYTDMLRQLNQATELSQLAAAYGNLMNTELLQQAERQLDDKKRINMEVALFMNGGHLKPD